MELDHLLYVGPDLAELQRNLAANSGLTAAVGGQHPGQGTHNALVGLGPASYLELMAPDPRQAAPYAASAAGAAPPATFLRSISYATTPQLFTWCAKAASAAACAVAARSLGLEATVYAGSRLTPAGATLRWDLIIIEGHGLGGVVPFFIDWHDSPHPAASLGTSAAGQLELESLELSHPAAAAVTELLVALTEASGTSTSVRRLVNIVPASEPQLVAHLRGPAGSFELRGRGGELLTTSN